MSMEEYISNNTQLQLIMKKICSLLLLLQLCLSVQAQVQRNFWGLELGRSTKADVKAFLSYNGLEYTQNLGGFDVISVESEEGVSFGGYSWTPSFQFYNNILFRVTLLQINKGITSSGEYYDIDTKFMFNNLKSKLSNRYGNLENPLNGQSQNQYVRRDLYTVVDMLFDDGNLVLSYYDRKLARASRNGNDM